MSKALGMFFECFATPFKDPFWGSFLNVLQSLLQPLLGMFLDVLQDVFWRLCGLRFFCNVFLFGDVLICFSVIKSKEHQRTKFKLKRKPKTDMLALLSWICQKKVDKMTQIVPKGLLGRQKNYTNH